MGNVYCLIINRKTYIMHVYCRSLVEPCLHDFELKLIPLFMERHLLKPLYIIYYLRRSIVYGFNRLSILLIDYKKCRL